MGSLLFPSSGPTIILTYLFPLTDLTMGNEREERVKSQEIGYGGWAGRGKMATVPIQGQVATLFQH